MQATQLVTGAFGYSGRAITSRLLARGDRVRTLTNSPDRPHPFGDAVEVHPLDFDDRPGLLNALAGVDVLFNTYWVRFSKAGFSQDRAIQNSAALFDAAREAGVRRIVHVSITNPSADSPYEYFRGKARIEQALLASGVPHTVLRPAVLFGGPDILINNIAWMLRHFPVFALPGKGYYRLQPIHVDDLADLALSASSDHGNTIIDAIGPETWTFVELVTALGQAIGKPRRLLHMPRSISLAATWLMGLGLRDVILTREEIDALMDGLLATNSDPVGKIRLSHWMLQHGSELGKTYASELARRRNRTTDYARA
jgi:NADH dehydrogenase